MEKSAFLSTSGSHFWYHVISCGKEAVSFVGAKVSVGAMGDSYYEYLLKQWIQGGKKDALARLKDAWKRVDLAAERARRCWDRGTRQRNRMDHLACFVARRPGTVLRMMMEASVDPRWEPFAVSALAWFVLAAELTYTCYQMYVRMPTGLSPEYVAFNLQAARGQEMSVPGDAPHNLLRPEAAEALWYMWYYTGDHKYRQWAKYGFSAITDVRKKPPPKRDAQVREESFWLGETLKRHGSKRYFYLLFSPRTTLNLEEFVLNTEAQPLRIMAWSLLVPVRAPRSDMLGQHNLKSPVWIGGRFKLVILESVHKAEEAVEAVDLTCTRLCRMSKWAVLGPWMFSSGVDPLAAFGGIQDVAGRLPSTFWTALRERAELWHDSFSEQLDYDKALNKVFSHLAAKNSSLLPRALSESLESFPTEVGPGGRTLWGFALANYSDETVEVNFTQLAVTAGWTDHSALECWSTALVGMLTAPVAAGRNPKLFSDETGHGSGWAMGEFNLTSDATILAKCSSSFYLDSDLALRLADVYGENRSVHILHLQKGQHRVFVKAAEPGFRCEFLLDGAAAREALTGVAAGGPEKVLSPFVLLKDVAVSEVIGSDLASPHLGTLANLAFLLVDPQGWLQQAPGTKMPPECIPILNTAREPLHLLSAACPGKLEEGLSKKRRTSVSKESIPAICLLYNLGTLPYKVFTFTVALQPEGNHAPVHASITTQCRRSANRGFLVAYPDFDGSIQKLWAAPPDVSQFANRTCPPRGCPVMLSLHGYELGGETLGLDNAWGALRYVRDELPGAPGNVTERRKSHSLDDTRVLVTGHSMGGHGCFVFASLLDGTRRGLLEAARFEHAADFAHENLVGVPMLVIYGSKDDNVPPTQPRNMVRLLESAGQLVRLQKDSTVTAVELPGVGHWFGQDEPSLAKWFQERPLHETDPDFPDGCPYREPSDVAAAKEKYEQAMGIYFDSLTVSQVDYETLKSCYTACVLCLVKDENWDEVIKVTSLAEGDCPVGKPRFLAGMKVAKKRAQLERASVALINGNALDASELLKQACENLDVQATYTEQWYGDRMMCRLQEQMSCLNTSFAGGDLRLPELPEYFEFSVTSPATYGSRGSLQASEPGRIFVQRCPKTKQNITACTGIVAPDTGDQIGREVAETMGIPTGESRLLAEGEKSGK
ncbi:Mannosyl-oligosaccharide 1,2-alpha-mannosidase MNS1 [Symbiodinium microadriaticum]|uniref:alpha-1,2-Mannosidase n=1 Tax=Symbiodinium microadriaticum TaxID=2951 RepID=A0A1Q9EHP0_SYMMI|nr:Mannosyl-oligosaccharide 1,2-alpha-mannosidase MNS1 [Symbiodinium microadriaticum]